MTENTLQLISCIKLAAIAGYAALWGYGGLKWKPLRRVFGSFLLLITIVLTSLLIKHFSWFYLLVLPLLVGATSIGYGENSALIKVLKNKILVRFVCGLLYSISFLPIVIIQNCWEFFAFHILLCTVTSAWLGTRNFTKSARFEESIIGGTVGLGIFSV